MTCRWPRFEQWIKGHTYPLIEQGRLRPDNMLHSHVSQADLNEALRLHGVDDVTTVAAAFKERNGEISLIRRESA